MMLEIRKFLYWQGHDANNQFLQGYIFTRDTAVADQFLSAQGIRVHKFKPKWEVIKSFKLKSRTTIAFYRQLSALLRAGLPLTQALATLADMQEVFFKKILLAIKMHIEVGNSFSASLRKHPRYFDNFSCQLIHIAENTGTLDTMLEHIALFQEKKKKFTDSVKHALLYPSVVFVIAVIITLLMLLIVVPQFASIFAEFDATLPSMTLAIIRFSHFLRVYFWLALLPLPLLYWLHQYYQHSLPFKLKIQNTLFSLPPLKNLLQIYFSAKFAHALSLMVSAGVPMANALSLLEKISFSQKAKLDVNILQAKISKGFALHASMDDSHLFSPLMRQMVKVGEESGMLADMLQHVAHLHETELQQMTQQIVELLEPLIILVLGVLIGSIVVSLYLPIFKLGTVL